MAFDIDALLLDRVFQPCVNATADRLSCFALARIALAVAVEAQMLTLFWDAVEGGSAFSVGFSAFALVLTLFGAQQAWRVIMRAERQSRSGTMNVRRITLRGQRMTWLAVCAGCVALLIPHGDIRAVFQILSCGAWLALIYFVSCTPLPPARRRATGFIAGLSGAGA